tara:strand:- start:3699 stop:4901 length:1203 start_codon:yes stop_codon:yes gene_type:complete
MFRIFYADSDSTMYEANSLQSYNTGLDEILEVGKQLDTDGETLVKSRFAVKFDMSEIQDTLTKYSADLNSCKFVLQLFTTNATNLPADYTLDAKLMGQPWTNGTGYSTSTVATMDGISWATPHASWSFSPSGSQTLSGSYWISSSQVINTGAPSLYVSGSGLGGSWLWQSGSGIFNTSSFDSSYFYQPGLTENESFSYRPTDINMDVTGAVKTWISGSGNVSVDNNGFLIKFSDADEADGTKTGIIKFFSRETHTIYVPRLTMYWDNSTFTTGSLSSVNLESYLTYSKTKPSYKDTEITKIRIYARDKFPQKSPSNLFPLETVKHLPTTTYYAIRDAATDEYIIPFDNIYNKVSCDSTSNFIHVDMNSFMPERYYRIELKIEDGFMEDYIDDEIYFKVVR